MELTGIGNTLKGYEKVGKADSSPKKGKSAHSSPPSGDSVRISNQGKLFTEAMTEARNTPDVRQRKVDELRALVESGEYEPDLRKTAARLVEEDFELLI